MTQPATAPASGDIVAMTDLSFTWPGRRSFTLAIERFTVPARQRLLVIGPSGSGKSTFLSLLCGIVTPQAGRIEILGTDMTKLSGTARDRFRAEHFGIIFQMFNLLPYGSVLDNALLPLSFAAQRRSRAAAGGGPEREACRIFSRLGLDEELIKAPAASLSVGQQQRVAAARALIGRPEFVVADEPTSALDRKHQLAFLDLLFAEVAAAEATLIMVSHDETLAGRFDSVQNLTDFASATRGRPA